MAEATDIRLDDDGDLKIKDGDFDTGLSDQAHIEHILLANKGTYRFEPLIGVNLPAQQNATNSGKERRALEKKIRLNLELDGFQVLEVTILSMEDIKINAKRKR